jgi:hypothetical protein
MRLDPQHAGMHLALALIGVSAWLALRHLARRLAQKKAETPSP